MIKLFKHVKIQTNNTCNRKCSYCYYGNCRQPAKLELSEHLFYKIIDNLVDLGFTGRIGYFETNEPLTDRRIFDFIKYAKNKLPHAWHMIATNGDLLDADKLQRLFECGLNEVKISVYDDKTFEKSNQLKNASPYLIEILDQRNPAILDNRGGNIENSDFGTFNETLVAGCDRIHNVLCIRPSGNVVSCCCDFYEVNCFGNVADNRLEEIWNNDQFEVFRKSLDNLDRSISSLCSKCNYSGIGGFFKVQK